MKWFEKTPIISEELFRKVTEKLMEFMKIGYPELTEKESELKIKRWLNMPNTYLGHSTPRDLCEKGQEEKVLLLIESLKTH